MSEWENTFGEGVSADSVIDGINAGYFRDMRDSEQEERDERLRSVLAYRSSGEVKARFLGDLKQAASEGDLLAKDRGLPAVLERMSVDYSWLEEHLRIPDALSILIGAVFRGLRQSTSFASPTQKEVEEAVEWLLNAFDAIQVGTDLRFIVDQFMASTAVDGLAFMKSVRFVKDTDRDIVRAAFDVLCLRARGVIPPEALVRTVREALGTIASKDVMNSPYEAFTREEAIPCFMAYALDNRPDMASLVGATNSLSSRISGDVIDIDFWRVYAERLLALIKGAPAKRLRIIDVNQVETTIGQLLVGLAPR